ncbi:MAG: SpoIIAA family protein [Planctomycetota bacterium]
MSATLERESEDLFVIAIKGIFTYDDLKGIESKIEGRELKQQVKILVHVENFEGWGKGGDWGNVSFMHEHDPYIEKIAIISTEEWKDEMLMFVGAGYRQASVEIFLEGKEEDARVWLRS